MTWDLLERGLQPFGYIQVDGRRYRLPSGIEVDWDVQLSRPTATVLAVTPRLEVILVRQYRPGPDRHLFELPGGFVDAGESPRSAASRELREEAGYSGTVFDAGGFWDSASSERYRYAFVATNCTKVAETVPDDEEAFEVLLVDMDSFLSILRSGELSDTHVAFRCVDLILPYRATDVTEALRSGIRGSSSFT